MRHKWKKHYYNGKYSSFEAYAVCKVCGCVRDKERIPVRYTDNKGELHIGIAPECKPLEQS